MNDSEEPPNHVDVSPPRRRRWPRLLAVGFLGWLTVAAVQLVVAGVAARQAESSIDDLRRLASDDLGTLVDTVGGSSDDVDEEDAAAMLRRGSDEFATVARNVGSPIVAPLRYTPVLGRQLRVVDALATSAETTTDAASDAVTELESILKGNTSTGAQRLAAVEHTESVLRELDAQVSELDLGPTDALLPPVAHAHDRFARELAGVEETLGTTLAAVTGVRSLLEGPSRYLLLAANNAEMRAGSGMFLQVGELEVSEGVFSIGDLEPTGDILPERSVEVDPDVAALWGVLEPGREWRNVNLTPRFDVAAATAARMWEAVGGEPVDGVIAVDVLGAERLLEVTGPVTLQSGETVAAEDVVEDLLVTQYETFGDDRSGRRERLGEVTKAAFTAINERPVSASELLKALRDLGAGRHIMAWSADPVQQDAWRALEADGELTPDGLLLSLLNRGGNKLDPYMRVTAEVSIDEADRGNRRVAVRVAVRNEAPPGLPSYVAGPYPRLDVAEGEYKGLLALNFPAAAGNATVDGGVPAAVGLDGVSQLLATEVRIPPGESVEVAFTFDLPAGVNTLRLLPGARIPPTTWVVTEDVLTDERSERIELSAQG